MPQLYDPLHQVMPFDAVSPMIGLLVFVPCKSLASAFPAPRGMPAAQDRASVAHADCAVCTPAQGDVCGSARALLRVSVKHAAAEPVPDTGTQMPFASAFPAQVSRAVPAPSAGAFGGHARCLSHGRARWASDSRRPHLRLPAVGPAQAFFLATMRNTQKLRENALFLSRVREDASQAPERGFGRAGSATGVRDGPGEARQAPYHLRLRFEAPYHLLPLSGEEDPPSHKHYPTFVP